MNSKFKVGDILRVVSSRINYKLLENDIKIGDIVVVREVCDYSSNMYTNTEHCYYKVIPVNSIMINDQREYNKFPFKGMFAEQFKVYTITKKELKAQFPKEIKIIKKHLKSLKI